MFYPRRSASAEEYRRGFGQVISIGPSRWACRIAVAVLLAAASYPAPADAAATFSLHYIEPAANTTWASGGAMQGTLSDLDNDGDLDWTVGVANGDYTGFYWYEYQSADLWLKHTIATGNTQNPLLGNGAASLDVNNDGYRDLVSGSYLFLNNGNKTFSSAYNIGTTTAWDSNHDHLAVDINGDGKLDLLSTHTCKIWAPSPDYGQINWYKAPANYTSTWTKTAISTGTGVPPGYEGLHAGTSPYGAGDLDGDGDKDVVGACGWYENTNGIGTSWTTHFNTGVFLGVSASYAAGEGYQTCVRSQVLDLNGDGRLDIVQAEADIYGDVRIAWLENNGGGNFSRNIIRSGHPEDYHSLAVADFDRDGDMDIFTAAGPLASGTTGHALYLFENTAGPGNDPSYALHNFAESLSASDAAKLAAAFAVDHGHEPMFGDVNGDGKIDLILKGWDGHTVENNKLLSPAPFLYLLNTTIDPAVTWTGATSTIWSTAAGSGNWKRTSDNGTADYANGIAVTFDDSATGLTANIGAADVSPASVAFNNTTKDFVVTGSKGIAGTTAVLKQGTGKLTLSSVNNYTGLTTVSAGVVNIQNASAFGSTAAATLVSSGAALQIQGSITTLAEPLTLNGTGVSNSGALRSISGNNSYAGPVTLGSNGVRINSDSDTLTLSNTGSIGGGGYAMTVGGLGNTIINSAIGTGASTLTKDGEGKLTLTGANAYTGATTVQSGRLQFNKAAAWNPVLNLGGADIKAGTMIFDYTGEGSPSAAIGALLTASYHSGSSTHFDTGKFQSSTADANHGLGWIETMSQQVLVAYTLYGDATVDGTVDISDLSALGQNWNGNGKYWSQGDFNYDGKVDISDLSALGQHWNQSVPGFGGGDSGATVPEPSSCVLLGVGALGLLAHYWRRRQ